MGQTAALLAFFLVPLTLGVWVRTKVPNFLAADISFETVILLGLLLGPGWARLLHCWPFFWFPSPWAYGCGPRSPTSLRPTSPLKPSFFSDSSWDRDGPDCCIAGLFSGSPHPGRMGADQGPQLPCGRHLL